MFNRRTASAFTIAALLACTLPVRSAASSVFSIPFMNSLAQTQSFGVPTSVPDNMQVRIVSSTDNMSAISEALRQGFQGQYSGARVDVSTKDAEDALEDVLKGNADLAAISRPLTAEEEAKGLIAVPVRREKIAIVVNKANPFDQSITGSQFAQIFRGEISNWSAVGGPAGEISVVDRPDFSETRQALRPYPVFTTAEFKAADGATVLDTDTTDALVDALGPNGIGYVLVGELADQPDLKALKLHQTLPDDPLYPFSQPYSFVYAGGASSEVSAFLGYATGNPGQTAIQQAGISGVGILPGATAAAAGTATGAGSADSAAGDSANVGQGEGGAAGADGTAAGGSNNGDAAGTDATATGAGSAEDAARSADGDAEGADAQAGTVSGDDAGRNGLARLFSGGQWWWLLLPLAGLGLLIWAAGKRGSDEETGYLASTEREGRIRSNFDGQSASVGPTGGNLPDSKVAVGKAAAGGAAIAGGAMAAGAGLAGKASGAVDGLRSGASNTLHSGIDSVKGGIDGATTSLQGGVDGVKTNLQGGVDGVKTNIQGGVDGVKTRIQGGIDGVKTNIQGGVDGAKTQLQGGVDGVKTNLQGGVDGVKTNLQGGVDGARTHLQDGVDAAKGKVNDLGQAGGDRTGNLSPQSSNGVESWLDRAKKRINDATEQIKDTASDIKDDVTDKDR